MSTNTAAARLAVTIPTVYRSIDTDDPPPGHKSARVIRSRGGDVDAFTEASRVKPGTLTHLHPRLDEDT